MTPGPERGAVVARQTAVHCASVTRSAPCPAVPAGTLSSPSNLIHRSTYRLGGHPTRPALRCDADELRWLRPWRWWESRYGHVRIGARGRYRCGTAAMRKPTFRTGFQWVLECTASRTHGGWHVDHNRLMSEVNEEPPCHVRSLSGSECSRRADDENHGVRAVMLKDRSATAARVSTPDGV